MAAKKTAGRTRRAPCSTVRMMDGAAGRTSVRGSGRPDPPSVGPSFGPPRGGGRRPAVGNGRVGLWRQLGRPASQPASNRRQTAPVPPSPPAPGDTPRGAHNWPAIFITTTPAEASVRDAPLVRRVSVSAASPRHGRTDHRAAHSRPSVLHSVPSRSSWAINSPPTSLVHPPSNSSSLSTTSPALHIRTHCTVLTGPLTPSGRLLAAYPPLSPPPAPNSGFSAVHQTWCPSPHPPSRLAPCQCALLFLLAGRPLCPLASVPSTWRTQWCDTLRLQRHEPSASASTRCPPRLTLQLPLTSAQPACPTSTPVRMPQRSSIRPSPALRLARALPVACTTSTCTFPSKPRPALASGKLQRNRANAVRTMAPHSLPRSRQHPRWVVRTPESRFPT